MGRQSLGLVVAAFVGAVLSCVDRPIDPEPEDFTAEVERICADYCEIYLACREEPVFDSYHECEHSCLHTGYIYNDTNCGAAKRGISLCAKKFETNHPAKFSVEGEQAIIRAETRQPGASRRLLGSGSRPSSTRRRAQHNGQVGEQRMRRSLRESART